MDVGVEGYRGVLTQQNTQEVQSVNLHVGGRSLVAEGAWHYRSHDQWQLCVLICIGKKGGQEEERERERERGGE